MSTTTGTTTTRPVRHGQQRHARERQHPPQQQRQGSDASPHPERTPGRTDARRPPDTGGLDTYDPPQGFPACRACCAVLPPLPAQGRARLWCGAGCRVWAGRHPGLTRAGRGVSERSREALELWAGKGWEASQQPWSWPISWQGTKARARALLAATGAG